VVYVNWRGEPAFILNLSEGGMAVQAMEVLPTGEALRLSFPLPDEGAELRGVARVVWSDRSGRAGLQFVDISEYDRFQLREWLKRNAS
jgi:Tfp pilus assembly protein PilZ